MGLLAPQFVALSKIFLNYILLLLPPTKCFDLPQCLHIVMIRYLITDLPGREESESSPVNHVESHWDRNRLSTAGTVIQKREFCSKNVQFQAAEDNKTVLLGLILGKSTGNQSCGFLGKKNQQNFQSLYGWKYH